MTSAANQKPRLLHIGFPKCMSTTLQRDFFACHPEIEFLGWGRRDSEHGWISDDVAALCEVGIRFEKALCYDEKAAKRTISKHVLSFKQCDPKKLLCLSSESFSFSMHFDVDATIKARRLKKLLGSNTKILIVVRNQLDLFVSYYYECVRGGYPGYFSDFLDFHYHYQFHSILSDLHYFRTYTLYCDLFGKDSVMVLPMELLVRDSAEQLAKLSVFSGISQVPLPLRRHNDSDDKKYLQALRLLNEKFANNRGNTYFGWVDGEKLVPYWATRLGTTEPEASRRNYSTKMLVYRTAEAVVTDFVTPLEAKYSERWGALLSRLYGRDNRALSDAIGVDLEHLGYPCN